MSKVAKRQTTPVVSTAAKSELLKRRILEAEVINPAELTPTQRDAFARRLFRLHQRIFAGVSIELFAEYVFRPKAVRTRVQIYRNEQGYMVGYCAHHVIELIWEARAYGIFRAEAGLLEGYRGSAMTFRFGGWETLRYKVLHPRRTTLLFATPVHPSSYHMLCRHYWRCYPHPERRTPDRLRRLLLHLVKTTGLEPVDPDDPLVLRVGWITRETDADRSNWRKNPHADIQYFLARNPNYGSGHGLAMIAPLNVASLTMTFFKYAWHLANLQKKCLRFLACGA